MVHLVYCDNTGKSGERVLDKISQGLKTMVVRGAAGRKIPHSRVYENETIYFMEKGTSLISVFAKVKSVKNLVQLVDEEIAATFEKYQHKLNLSDKQRLRWHKKCLCLVEFDRLEKIETPLAFDHQGNMDDWLIIEKIEDVVVGSSIPYDYSKSKF